MLPEPPPSRQRRTREFDLTADSDPEAFSPLSLAGRGAGPGRDTARRRPFPFSATASPSPRFHPVRSPGFTEPEEEEEDGGVLHPRNQSFSRALRECQNRRFRSEAHPLSLCGKKYRRRRHSSLDLYSNQSAGDVTVLSPRFLVGAAGGMKGPSGALAASSRSRSGTFPSPGTPNYVPGAGAGGYPKGWSSEHVLLPANFSKRYGGSSALLPFGNGRALPSKWEDAEKWIMSPVSTDGVVRSTLTPGYHRPPKSKSGPLGAPVRFVSSSAAASPLIPCFDSGRVNFTANSPFMAGVLVTERGCCGNGGIGKVSGCVVGDGRGRRSYSANDEPYIVRSASVHGWSDMLVESPCSSPSSQGSIPDEGIDRTEDVETMISPVVIKKDMATQMSPAESTQSSPKERPSLSPSPKSTQPTFELENQFPKLEIRDVQVDDRVTVTRWSKKHVARASDRCSTNIIQWKKRPAEARSCAWDVAEASKCMSKYKREEAKITAWENLQKAKAEAAIRKLEMKLEKKRSSSMDKILNKLRSAQRKAQEMRNAVNASQANQVARTTKRVSYFRSTGQKSSLGGCFTCHAF